MIKKIKNININYVMYGDKNKDTIVLLHGWGQNIEMMKPIGEPLSKDYNVLILDLPGHGLSEEPEYPWEFTEFVDCVKKLLEELKINNPIMMGHSFGGKISLLFASKCKVK